MGFVSKLLGKGRPVAIPDGASREAFKLAWSFRSRAWLTGGKSCSEAIAEAEGDVLRIGFEPKAPDGKCWLARIAEGNGMEVCAIGRHSVVKEGASYKARHPKGSGRHSRGYAETERIASVLSGFRKWISDAKEQSNGRQRQ